MSERWIKVKGYIKPSSGKAVLPHARKTSRFQRESYMRANFVSEPPVDEKNETHGTPPEDKRSSLTKEKILTGVSFDGQNYSGSIFTAGTYARCSFKNTNLKNAKFGGRSKGTKMEIVNFDFSDLRGAVFKDIWFNNVSFEGADLTGTKFEKVWVSSTGTVLLAGAKLAAETFDELAFSSPLPPIDPKASFRYRRLHAIEAASRLGVDDNEMKVLLWAGDVEVRDNDTLQRVVGRYDPERHHIPEWAAQRNRR